MSAQVLLTIALFLIAPGVLLHLPALTAYGAFFLVCAVARFSVMRFRTDDLPKRGKKRRKVKVKAR